MKWKKMGRIFEADPSYDWMQTYAWVPSIQHLGGDRYRVYFGGRNKDNFSQTGYFEFDINEPTKVLKVSEEPVIKLGELGMFDDSLALATSFVEHEGKCYLYYVGWMQGKRTRYYPLLGVSISEDGGLTYKKNSVAPMIARTNEEPYGMASPFVMIDEGKWKLWYASYRRWELRDGDVPWPQYELRYAESDDGINWELKNHTCIGTEEEEAVARPYIIKEDGIYKMWYSYRKQFDKYKIGYAESNDGMNWTRMDDKAGIDCSEEGWDSEMIEYPCIFKHGGETYLLYNGNTHGLTGIGLAILEK